MLDITATAYYLGKPKPYVYIPERKRKKFPLTLFVLNGLILADGYLTAYLTSVGMATEVNPIMEGAIKSGNLLRLKLAASLVITILLLSMFKRRPNIASTTTLIAVTVYTAIIFWNIFTFHFSSFMYLS